MADHIHLGHITNHSTVRGLAAGVDTVFSTIGITRQKYGLTYNDVDYQRNVNLLEEAERSATDTFLSTSPSCTAGSFANSRWRPPRSVSSIA